MTALVGHKSRDGMATDQPELKGAYVLAVQTPTYWMDEGDGVEWARGVWAFILSPSCRSLATMASHPPRLHRIGCIHGLPNGAI